VYIILAGRVIVIGLQTLQKNVRKSKKEANPIYLCSFINRKIT